ncbi:hypothetical protein [uncultured Draconibacterium sp.]|uniref:hypothetical protein n=1 Tax=uncultured Draconibacterium sp. TaxID=1573823 RepID=UPI0025F8BAB2|nr:hypothetical protein [uncultured Draconibacterium sp.]
MSTVSIKVYKKKSAILLLLFLLSIIALSQNSTQDFEPLNIEKVSADIDTIKQEMDSTFHYIKATYAIIKEETRLFGWKKTIQINSSIFLPIVFFVGLYLLWLANRTLNK